MTKPNEHYHRIETADMIGTTPAQDAMYYLTRADGMLVRLNELTRIKSEWNVEEIRRTLQTAQAFLSALRNALDPDRIDVT
jgi:hypothetical protein